MPKARTRGNGQGTVFKMPNGKWRVEKSIYRNGKLLKRYTKSGFSFKRDASAYLNELNAGAIKIQSNITFKEIYDLWSVPHYEKVSNDTSNGYKAAYRHCEKLWFMPMASIKAADLQAVVDNCTLSRRTKEDIKYLLSTLYKYATQNDYIDKDYSTFVKLPKKEKSKKDAFTTDELDALWKDYNSGSMFTGIMLIMIYTGMRYGEISRLTRNNIDLENRCIIGAGIKTEAGRNRVIPIADCIYSIVQKLYEKTDKKLLAMHEKIFYNDFRCTLERLGIRQLNPHCCRHTFATLTAKENIPPSVIISMIGHEKYEMTLGYTHIKLDDQLKAVNALYVPSSSTEL